MAQQPKVVKVGPGGRSNGPRPKVENPGKVFKRILAYVMSRYKAQVIVVLCCILLAVFAQLDGGDIASVFDAPVGFLSNGT